MQNCGPSLPVLLPAPNRPSRSSSSTDPMPAVEVRIVRGRAHGWPVGAGVREGQRGVTCMGTSAPTRAPQRSAAKLGPSLPGRRGEGPEKGRGVYGGAEALGVGAGGSSDSNTYNRHGRAGISWAVGRAHGWMVGAGGGAKRGCMQPANFFGGVNGWLPVRHRARR